MVEIGKGGLLIWISIGLLVCSAISSFLDAWKDRRSQALKRTHPCYQDIDPRASCPKVKEYYKYLVGRDIVHKPPGLASEPSFDLMWYP